MVCRRILVCTLACALAAAGLPASPAGAGIIGVVTQASAAYVGTAALTSGATVYEGDRLSTEARGGVRVRSAAALLYLAGQSSVTLHAAPGGALANLNSGTVVFSTAKAAAMQIAALNAIVRPANDDPTVAQISIVGPKVLQVVVRRGELQFSYGNNSQSIPEGSSVRVILDPPNDPSKAPPLGGAYPPPAGKPGKGFLIIVSATVGVLTWIAIDEALESPDRP